MEYRLHSRGPVEPLRALAFARCLGLAVMTVIATACAASPSPSPSPSGLSSPSQTVDAVTLVTTYLTEAASAFASADDAAIGRLAQGPVATMWKADIDGWRAQGLHRVRNYKLDHIIAVYSNASAVDVIAVVKVISDGLTDVSGKEVRKLSEPVGGLVTDSYLFAGHVGSAVILYDACRGDLQTPNLYGVNASPAGVGQADSTDCAISGLDFPF